METQAGREKEGLLPLDFLRNGGALLRDREGSTMPRPWVCWRNPQAGLRGLGAGQALANGSELPPRALRGQAPS